jgi:hypothetical protein
VIRSQAYPKAKRRVPQPLNDAEVLVLGILSLWRGGPSFFYDDSNDPGAEWTDSSVRIWESTVDNSVKASALTNAIMVAQPILQAPSLGPRTEMMTGFMKRLL